MKVLKIIMQRFGISMDDAPHSNAKFRMDPKGVEIHFNFSYYQFHKPGNPVKYDAAGDVAHERGKLADLVKDHGSKFMEHFLLQTGLTAPFETKHNFLVKRGNSKVSEPAQTLIKGDIHVGSIRRDTYTFSLTPAKMKTKISEFCLENSSPNIRKKIEDILSGTDGRKGPGSHHR